MEAFAKISTWIDAGEPLALIAAAMAVAVCFVVFNVARTALYLPQLVTCWRDEGGCAAINLFTWSSWIVANASTGLYMWIFQHDSLGLLLSLSNAAMCSATVAVAAIKRRRHAMRLRRRSPELPSSEPRAMAALSS
jgi:hypothetical protein